eukprot:TRINITY_DN67032_c8_g2_i4.p2 TRINITY_DN67032_c8_g2~~TRINITY_DN67032_c8_g2_i4.p2  ORF type:complete len:120 (-),score=69.78 TRINITY_DN67032_c8_g2_i4:309-668(-)
MRTLSINASQAELDLMIDEIDKNKDGEIQFDEFVAVMSRKVQATYTSKQVKGAFKVFEGNAPPGYIKLEDLERALSVYGSDRLTREQINGLINQIASREECDNNGMFNYSEYVNMMMTD